MVDASVVIFEMSPSKSDVPLASIRVFSNWLQGTLTQDQGFPDFRYDESKTSVS